MTKKNIRKRFRSGFEKCPICDTQTKLVEHHINGRIDYQSYKKHNIVWICPNCHDQIHNGNINVEGWINSTGGKILLFEYVNVS